MRAARPQGRLVGRVSPRGQGHLQVRAAAAVGDADHADADAHRALHDALRGLEREVADGALAPVVRLLLQLLRHDLYPAGALLLVSGHRRHGRPRSRPRRWSTGCSACSRRTARWRGLVLAVLRRGQSAAACRPRPGRQPLGHAALHRHRRQDAAVVLGSERQEGRPRVRGRPKGLRLAARDPAPGRRLALCVRPGGQADHRPADAGQIWCTWALWKMCEYTGDAQYRDAARQVRRTSSRRRSWTSIATWATGRTSRARRARSARSWEGYEPAIAALVFADMGDKELALEAAKDAATWSWTRVTSTRQYETCYGQTTEQSLCGPSQAQSPMVGIGAAADVSSSPATRSGATSRAR